MLPARQRPAPGLRPINAQSAWATATQMSCSINHYGITAASTQALATAPAAGRHPDACSPVVGSSSTYRLRRAGCAESSVAALMRRASPPESSVAGCPQAQIAQSDVAQQCRGPLPPRLHPRRFAGPSTVICSNLAAMLRRSLHLQRASL